MNKIKNIRQAFNIMKKRFPEGFVTVEMKRYSLGDIKTAYTLYTGGEGVFGTGPSWDEAFVNLHENIVGASND